MSPHLQVTTAVDKLRASELLLPNEHVLLATRRWEEFGDTEELVFTTESLIRATTSDDKKTKMQRLVLKPTTSVELVEGNAEHQHFWSKNKVELVVYIVLDEREPEQCKFSIGFSADARKLANAVYNAIFLLKEASAVGSEQHGREDQQQRLERVKSLIADAVAETPPASDDAATTKA